DGAVAVDEVSEGRRGASGTGAVEGAGEITGIPSRPPHSRDSGRTGGETVSESTWEGLWAPHPPIVDEMNPRAGRCCPHPWTTRVVRPDVQDDALEARSSGGEEPDVVHREPRIDIRLPARSTPAPRATRRARAA